MSKRIVSFTVDEKILEDFNKVKGCYNKSALVESWIKDFVKKGHASHRKGVKRE